MKSRKDVKDGAETQCNIQGRCTEISRRNPSKRGVTFPRRLYTTGGERSDFPKRIMLLVLHIYCYCVTFIFQTRSNSHPKNMKATDIILFPCGKNLLIPFLYLFDI